MAHKATARKVMVRRAMADGTKSRHWRGAAILGLLLLAGRASPAEEAPAAPGSKDAARGFWPAWRGPEGTGTAPLADPPLEWSEEKNIRWKVEIPGSGTATPIVWGDLVFIQTAVRTGEGGAAKAEEPAPEPGRRGRRGGRGGRGGPLERHRFLLLAVERGSGAVRWTAVAREETPHEGHHQDHGFASSSPVTDGERVYAYFGSRGLHAFDLDGKRLWEADFGDFNMKNGFGEGSSPALHGDRIVVVCDNEGKSFIVAADKRSGKELWRKDRDEESTWTTPVIVPSDGRTQVVVGATKRTRSYDLETGDLLWECGGQTSNVIPTPVPGFGKIFVTSGFRGNALQAIALDRKGDLSGTDAIAWSLARATPYVPSPLLHDGRIYFLSGNNPVLSSHDARTGEAVFSAHRLEGLNGVYASPVAAAGKIFVTGRNGATVVLANEAPPRVLATNVLDDRIDASPALAGGEIFLRGHRSLYAISKEPGAKGTGAAGKDGGSGKGF